MANPTIVQHQGALLGQSSPGVQCGSLMEVLSTTFQGAYTFNKGASPTLTNVVSGSPLVIPFEGMTKVSLLACRVTGGAITLMLTSSAGTDQLVPVGSDAVLLLHNPAPGSEFSAIKAYGNGNLTYQIFGNA